MEIKNILKSLIKIEEGRGKNFTIARILIALIFSIFFATTITSIILLILFLTNH